MSVNFAELYFPILAWSRNHRARVPWLSLDTGCLDMIGLGCCYWCDVEEKKRNVERTIIKTTNKMSSAHFLPSPSSICRRRKSYFCQKRFRVHFIFRTYLVCRFLWPWILQIVGMSYVKKLLTIISTYIEIDVDHACGPPLGFLLPLSRIESCRGGGSAAWPALHFPAWKEICKWQTILIANILMRGWVPSGQLWE